MKQNCEKEENIKINLNITPELKKELSDDLKVALKRRQKNNFAANISLMNFNSPENNYGEGK